MVDEHTKANCLDIFLKESQIKPKLIIEIQSGKTQNISSCEYIWQQLTNAQFDRKSLLVNLGGGVIGDMGDLLPLSQKGYRFHSGTNHPTSYG